MMNNDNLLPTEKICNKLCRVFSRVVGYYRPVDNFNDAKKQEFVDRVNFQELPKLPDE